MSASSFFTLTNAIRAMIIFGLGMVLLVIVQSCQSPKTGLERFSEGSLKKLTVLEAPPAQPQAIYKSPDGAQMRLSDYQGKVVLLNVWATWCAPCIAEMPSLDRLEAQMGGDDFAVVPISLDRRASDIPAFFDRANIENLPAWHDASFGLNGQLALPGLPTSIFYDRAGREIARIPGEAEWDSEDALALIAHLIERP